MPRPKGSGQGLITEIRFRGSRLDHARLAALARHHELTPSAVLRRLIAEEVARLPLLEVKKETKR